LGFPDKIPDYSTVWYFRERLSKTGKDKQIWKELQRQLDQKGLKVKKGVIQDATYITSDPGHANADKPCKTPIANYGISLSQFSRITKVLNKIYQEF